MADRKGTPAHVICRYCGKPIRFARTPKGRYQPIGVESGLPHFAECQPYLEMRAGQQLRRQERRP